MRQITVCDFDDWRTKARSLAAAGVPPGEIVWREPGGAPSLFGEGEVPAADAGRLRVPPAFVNLAEAVACHRSPGRWRLLYAALWRLTHGEPQLLHVATDDTVHPLRIMEKAVRRDVHKTHAFVRFRKCSTGAEEYVAWYRPDHRVLRRAVGLFVERFRRMKWAILTPDESAYWDGQKLNRGPGAAADDAPDGDELEAFWKAYYAAVFNPARVKVKAMKQEMPVRFWGLLPEAGLIPELLRDAPGRVRRMIDDV